MKKSIVHLLSQPFLIAVSVAALLHSSWSFSTLFGGIEPTAQYSGAWLAWVAPGVLLAFSVDIGLLSLANQIRSGQRSIGKLAAFGVLCLAMAYLQFCFIAVHAPAMTIGAGVRVEWSGLVTTLLNASIFVLPLLLPIALCLFAFSDSTLQLTNLPVSGATAEAAPAVAERPAPEQVEIECAQPGCAWAGTYKSIEAAQNALNAHQAKHTRELAAVISNGNGNGNHHE
jgi:hypothetical protein